MSLVNSKEIAKALNIEKYGVLGIFFGWITLKILRISRLNKIYDKHKDKSDLDFLNAILDEVGIQFEISENDLKRIPKENAFITISNHPLGGIDGILLLKLILEKRQDYKIIANFLLLRIKPLKPYVLAVNPFEDRKDVKSSVTGIKAALQHLQNGHPLGIFPAGEVSTNKDDNLVVDKPWEKGAVKLIKKAKAPIIPIYFHAKNSKLFYILSKINDSLRTAKLPSELLNQKNRVIKVRIGKPIWPKEQEEYQDIEDFHQFLRKKTYMLANSFETSSKKNISTSLKPKRKPKKIIEPVNPVKIFNEIKKIQQTESKLLQSKNYEVFLVSAQQTPNILKEIGRLREITFREIGEGTNKEVDLDKYDKFYKHLFLWDNQAQKIVGAYRMGIGKDIFKNHGINGFYINTLFRIEPELYSMMQKTIEMGRAWIRKEYQQKPMPLFLLWKGIIHVTLRYPDHQYLLGGVSISNQFSEFSKSLMIEFMKSNYYDPYVAQYIRPKKEYKVKLKDADKDFVFDSVKSDMKKFDKIIDEIEPDGLRIPVLLKKYIKQNCKLVAFNVDPKFNNAIDGLIYVRISDLPEKTVRPVLEEYQAELESRYSNNNSVNKSIYNEKTN
jgi:putative hemolysin